MILGAPERGSKLIEQDSKSFNIPYLWEFSVNSKIRNNQVVLEKK